MPFYRPKKVAGRGMGRGLMAPAMRASAFSGRARTGFGNEIPGRAQAAERHGILRKGIARESIGRLVAEGRANAEGRIKVVQEARNPIREATRLKARLKLAISRGDYEEAKKIFYEMLGNMELLEQYASALGKKSYSAMALKEQVSLLKQTQEELVRKGIIRQTERTE